MQFEVSRSVSFLKDLTDEELEAFCELLTAREVSHGEKVITEGQTMTEFFVVCKGCVHVRLLAEKTEMLLSQIPEGGFFGEINLFDAGSASASIYALSDTVLGVVSYDDLRAFLETHPVIGYKITSSLMHEVCQRLRKTNERLVTNVFWTASRR